MPRHLYAATPDSDTSPSSDPTTVATLDVILKSIAEVKVDVNALKTRFNSFELSTKPTMRPPEAVDKTSERTEDADPAEPHNGTDNEADDSIMTVDDNVPDDEQEPLNY